MKKLLNEYCSHAPMPIGLETAFGIIAELRTVRDWKYEVNLTSTRSF